MFGEVLEWVSGAVLVLAVALFFGGPAAVAASGVFLFYEAQNNSTTPIKLPKLPRILRRKAQDETE